jgi:hypothetical protein
MSLDPREPRPCSPIFSLNRARRALATPSSCVGPPSTNFSRRYGFCSTLIETSPAASHPRYQLKPEARAE